MSAARQGLTVAFVALLGLGFAGLAVALVEVQEEPFPHAAHQGLFPLCTGCHEGVEEGDSTAFYPEPAACVGCHNGVDRDSVAWQMHVQDANNLLFDHRAHAEELEAEGDPQQTCASCHVELGGGRMAVSEGTQLGTCWGCHAHEANDHYSDAECSTCHVPLAETAFGVDRIAALPAPRDHESVTFLLAGHGTMADASVERCVTCHTRERCVACHVDPDIEAIRTMPPARDGMDLPGAVARYEAPATHTDDGWLAGHSETASRESCATCHTVDDCASCHVAPLPEVLGSMPSRAETMAPGASLIARAPGSHESVFFMESHSALSAGRETSCATCHRETFCVDCHDGATDGGYHPSSFVSRHAADAFARDTDCANCHNAQAFCRECHVESGLVASGGRLSAGYHDGGPLWLLRHGQAARQALESCASCHKQIDCTQCHGVLGAFKVSPHSAGFDAARAWARNPRVCLGCHVRNPLNGAVP